MRPTKQVMGEVPDTLSNQLGIAIGKRTYKAYYDLMVSPRWQRAFNCGARPQRLLMAIREPKTPRPLTCCTSRN